VLSAQGFCAVAGKKKRLLNKASASIDPRTGGIQRQFVASPGDLVPLGVALGAPVAGSGNFAEHFI
jgi:hypothetical protein